MTMVPPRQAVQSRSRKARTSCVSANEQPRCSGMPRARLRPVWTRTPAGCRPYRLQGARSAGRVRKVLSTRGSRRRPIARRDARPQGHEQPLGTGHGPTGRGAGELAEADPQRPPQPRPHGGVGHRRGGRLAQAGAGAQPVPDQEPEVRRGGKVLAIGIGTGHGGGLATGRGEETTKPARKRWGRYHGGGAPGAD